jgi:predicted metal-dependent peptidase
VAGGPPGEHEKPDEGDQVTPAGISEAEQELMRMKVAQDVEAHAKSRGNVPGWLQRWAEDKLKSKVDWRRKLAARIRSDVASAKGMVDYSYQRPGRRSGAVPDFVWPSMREPTPRVHIQIDTSGSMSTKELGQAIAEVEGVLTTMRVELTVSAVDAAIHTTQKIFKATDVKLMGGGGTDMTLGLEAAEKMRPRPHVIICITDCETGWPSRPLRVPLIVARTSKGSPAPAWASVVDVVPDVK